VAYIKVMKAHLQKLDDRGTPAIFIGYERGAKAWRFYDPVIRRVVVSWDAVFDEPMSQSWEQEDMGLGNNLVMEYQALQLRSELPVAPMLEEDTSVPTPAALSPLLATPRLLASPSPVTPVLVATPPPQPEFISSPPDAEEYSDVDADDDKPRHHTINNILGLAAPPILAVCQVVATLHL
jgi:hypothetical protein